jgi:hypothetical protein
MGLRLLKLNLTPVSQPLMSHDVCSFLEEPPKPDLEPEFFPRVESPFNIGLESAGLWRRVIQCNA